MFRLAKIVVGALACSSAAATASSSATAPAHGSRWAQKPSPSDATALKPVDAALLARGGDIKSAPNLYLNAVELGAKKAAGKPRDIAILAVISGFHIGFGGWMAITIGGALPGIKAENPGLQKLIFALFGLPFGLFMVMVAGGELFTGNCAVVGAAAIEGKTSFRSLLKSWSMSWTGNLVGCILLAKLVMAAGMNTVPGAAAALATGKVSNTFHKTFLKGMICNWMVCMAVWIAAGASTLTEKYLAMLLPVSAFVVFGAEHSVANMFLLPLGMFSGSSGDIAWSDIFLKNLLPVTLGNIVGGAVCQAGLYSAVYGTLLK